VPEIAEEGGEMAVMRVIVWAVTLRCGSPVRYASKEGGSWASMA
jgi:hypothetical protein